MLLVGSRRAPSRRLIADRRGVTSVIFGLTFVALIIFAGATIDIARLEFVRERLISATDAAALAGGRTVNNAGSGAGYAADAANFFNANFPSGYLGSVNSASNPVVSLSTDGTQLTVSATVNVPLMFGKLVGHASPTPVSYTSTALAGQVEVAMVLDNSGSMNQTVNGDSSSKMSLLKTAATSFISGLTSLQNGSVRIAVVPFTMTVNLGLSQTSAPSWIDPKASYIYTKVNGALPTNALSVTTSKPTGDVFQDIFTDQNGVNSQQNRFSLFTQLRTSWAGCVEMRAPIYSTDGSSRFDVLDTTPTTSAPGSLVVPYFAPSEALTPESNNTINYFDLFYNQYMDDYGSDDSSATWQIQQGDGKKYAKPKNVQGFSSQQNTRTSPSYSGPYPFGPNAGCQGYSAADNSLVTLKSLSRLDRSTATSTNTISGMVPMGDTYLPIGLFWGWETISPNSVFGDQQADYNDPSITKVVILLTDGCNHNANPSSTGSANACGAYGAVTSSYDFPNESYYAATGYIWQNRLGPIIANSNASDPQLKLETDRQTIADAETLSICSNMKAKGILIYAIGIDVAGANNPVLSKCATAPGPPYYYSKPDPSDLSTTFQQIAQSLTRVRILALAGSAPGI